MSERLGARQAEASTPTTPSRGGDSVGVRTVRAVLQGR